MSAQPANAHAADQPALDMLHTCHARIGRECASLRELAEQLHAGGCDEQARQAAAKVVRYFDIAGRMHHDDEERDLFPRMLAAARGALIGRMSVLIESMRDEHRQLDSGWSALRPSLDAVARGERSTLDPVLVRKFTLLYQSHIAREEANVLPLAARILDAAQMGEIGTAMRARRDKPC